MLRPFFLQTMKKYTLPSRNHLTPEIVLHLMTPQCGDLWHATSSPFDHDPFWAIYWPGGQGLTRFILDHPYLIKDKSVMDLGCGCGAAAIACALSGASSVVANDIDPVALEAAKFNALANGTDINTTDFNFLDQPNEYQKRKIDVLLIGDMFFDEEIGRPLVKLALDSNSQILLGDPGRWVLREPEFKNLKLCLLAQYELNESTKEENYGVDQTFVFELRK